ncbi:hypothetical protein ABPG75_001763 [Micractinium tetrahymenae]
MAVIAHAAYRQGQQPLRLAAALLLFVGGMLTGVTLQSALPVPFALRTGASEQHLVQAAASTGEQLMQQGVAGTDERQQAQAADAPTAGAGEEQQPQQQASAPWADAPNVTVSVHLPDWAQCPQKPCNFTQMVAGEADTSVPFKSQFGEDRWLYNNLFFNRRNGFYVEMGAMGGMEISNSWWLYKAANWTGLLIEANPGLYGDLARDRSDSICVHAAVCGDFRTVHWYSAGNTGGIWELMADGFKKMHHKDMDDAKAVSLPEFPCVPMQWIFDRFGIAYVDLWSLDVEGAELEVLRTVDFSRMDIKVLIVELDGHSKEKDQGVKDLLAGAGYQILPKQLKENYHLNSFNTVFVRPDAWRWLSHAPDITEVTQ